MNKLEELQKENRMLKKILADVFNILIKYNSKIEEDITIKKDKSILVNSKDSTNINLVEKKDKKEIRELFASRYSLKIKEISGSLSKLPWSGKEGKLLNLDYETHGIVDLKKYIEIFFSDKDLSVADFTRYKNKAGYSYSVFHGMISKLSLSRVKVDKVCSSCGRAVGHNLDCSVYQKIIDNRRKEENEFEKLRIENENFSFEDAFKKVINKGT